MLGARQVAVGAENVKRSLGQAWWIGAAMLAKVICAPWRQFRKPRTARLQLLVGNLLSKFSYGFHLGIVGSSWRYSHSISSSVRVIAFPQKSFKLFDGLLIAPLGGLGGNVRID